MRRSRIQLVIRNCPRCGREMAGTNRPIFGSNEVHRRLAGVCEKCVTPEEREEIIRDGFAGLLGRSPQ